MGVGIYTKELVKIMTVLDIDTKKFLYGNDEYYNTLTIETLNECLKDF